MQVPRRKTTLIWTLSVIGLWAAAVVVANPVGAQPLNGEILFARFVGDAWDLFSTDPAGSGATRLTESAASEGSAVYSPEGSQIAFDSFGRYGSEIHLMNAEGSNRRPLTKGPFYKFLPQWSPTGDQILYQATSDLETDSIIFKIDTDATGKTMLTGRERINTQPAWSPDGTKIAYVHSTHGSSDIYVMNADGTNKRRLTKSETFETWPAWSPDGREIAFSRHRSGSNSNGYDILAIDLSGRVRPIANRDELSEEQPLYSPDGRRISYRGCQGTACGLEVVNAAGTNRRVLVPRGVEGAPPVWSPDSSQIAYSRLVPANDRFDVFVVEVGSGAISRLTDTRTDESVSSWRSSS
ncbi:MAG: TolB family protein [Actinomycetota bacterium]